MAGVKRKRPPTFQHLPAKRAKALKKTWVENVKVKSKWAAERRKAGLAKSLNVAQEDDHKSSDNELEGDPKVNVSVASPPTQAAPRIQPKQLPGSIKTPSQRNTRAAHSLAPRPVPSKLTQSATPSKRKSDSYTCRGQPNMKLRMEAMLEKIKKDLA